MLAADNVVLNGLWWMMWFVLFAAWILSIVMAVVMSFFVIWSRRDWAIEWRIVGTVLLAVPGLILLVLLPLVGYAAFAVYAIVDVATRMALTGREKAGWIVGLILVAPVAVPVYFVWALRNKPDAPEGSSIPKQSVAMPDDPRSTALSAEDLDYLQKLADLHTQGVLTDEQYEEQRNQRLGT